MSDDNRLVNYCCGTLKAAPSKEKRLDEIVWCERLKYSALTIPQVDGTPSETNTIQKGLLRICVVSDTHGEHNRLGVLPASDILIHAGDILYKSRKMSEATARGELKEFNKWLGRQKATYKIVIGGNHDQVLLDSYGEDGLALPANTQEHIAMVQSSLLTNAIYLCNSSVKLFSDTFTVVGTPMSVGQGSSNRTFQSHKFQRITQSYIESVAAAGTKVDLLITHGPCFNFAELLKPRVAHVYGHIHEDYGVRQVFSVVKRIPSSGDAVEMEVVKDPLQESTGSAEREPEEVAPTYRSWFRIAASIMNVDFQPRQQPFLVDIPVPDSVGDGC